MRAEPIGRPPPRQPCIMTKSWPGKWPSGLRKRARRPADIAPSRSGNVVAAHPGVPDGRNPPRSARGRADLRKPLADTQQQAVADLAIGLQLLLAAAIGAGGVRRRPVF